MPCNNRCFQAKSSVFFDTVIFAEEDSILFQLDLAIYIWFFPIFEKIANMFITKLGFGVPYRIGTPSKFPLLLPPERPPNPTQCAAALKHPRALASAAAAP
jgi:hypothetical protein